jgi:hypothetical protein
MYERRFCYKLAEARGAFYSSYYVANPLSCGRPRSYLSLGQYFLQVNVIERRLICAFHKTCSGGAKTQYFLIMAKQVLLEVYVALQPGHQKRRLSFGPNYLPCRHAYGTWFGCT